MVKKSDGWPAISPKTREGLGITMD
jgi:hypothetical protein